MCHMTKYSCGLAAFSCFQNNRPRGRVLGIGLSRPVGQSHDAGPIAQQRPEAPQTQQRVGILECNRSGRRRHVCRNGMGTNGHSHCAWY